MSSSYNELCDGLMPSADLIYALLHGLCAQQKWLWCRLWARAKCTCHLTSSNQGLLRHPLLLGVRPLRPLWPKPYCRGLGDWGDWGRILGLNSVLGRAR